MQKKNDSPIQPMGALKRSAIRVLLIAVIAGAAWAIARFFVFVLGLD